MSEDATYAVCNWIDNDPTRRHVAVWAARRGPDRLRDYLLGEVWETYKRERDGGRQDPFDGGPVWIAQNFPERELDGVDWAEVSRVLDVANEDGSEDE